MKKTSVYLTNDEAEALRRVSLSTGKSQSMLIREGIRHVIGGDEPAGRHFHSMGMGHGGGQPHTSWDPDDLYDKVMGRR